MRSLSFYCCLALLFFVFSCKKGGPGTGPVTPPVIPPAPPPLSSYYLSSMVNTYNRLRYVDSFTYDATHRLLRFDQTFYDTTNGTPNSSYLNMAFTLPSDGSPASAYTLTDGQTNELHNLSYDGQGRLIKDTCVSGTHFVNYFSYPAADTMAYRLLYTGTLQDRQDDTMILNNGNFVMDRIYYPLFPSGKDSLYATINLEFSSAANPAYHAEIAKSLGPLLFYNGFNGYSDVGDFISKNVFNKVYGTGTGSPITYTTLTTDDKGRLSQMTSGSPAGHKVVYAYY